MKKLLLPLLLAILFQTISFRAVAQTYIFYNNNVLRYKAATSEPDVNWYKPGFDDSSWKADTAVIGFGEPFIHRPVNRNTKSIYARFVFNITNKNAIKKMNFSPDYDDGYIAYLNGHEIARVNVDKSVKFPAYNALATRSHENETVRHFTKPVLGVYLDSMLLDTCLVNGENIVAIHVLNDSVNGSDLVLIPTLIDITRSPYYIYSDPSRYKALIDIDSSSLPLVVLNTNEFGIPYQKGIHTSAFMGIIDNGNGKYNNLNNNYNVYDGLISMEIHGQSSRDFPKQTYRFELKDSLGNDTSAILLGMPKDNDWILFGPFADRSQIRNKFIFDLGSRLGHYQPRSRFCELILNGQLVGLYALTENIKRGKDRVNIAKLKNTDIDGINVTGGYIFKYDKEDASKRTMVYPKDDSIQPEQKAYFDSFMKSYDSTFRTNKFLNRGYTKYLDDTSLVDYLIMNELSKNCDAYLNSTYCYKDREDKDNRVKFGPLWDYDLGFGNSNFQNGMTTIGWQWDEKSSPTTYFERLGIRRLLQDTVLVDFLQNRWNSLRENTLSDGALFDFIDSLTDYIKDARIRNYEVWPVIDQNPWFNNPTYLVSNYDEEISYFKNWLATRTKWMDDNMKNIYYPLKVYSSIEPIAALPKLDCEAYPNPFSDRLTLELNSDQSMNIRVAISNILGQTYYANNLGTNQGYQQIELSDQQISSLPRGIYLLRVFSDNSLVSTLKIIKN